MIKHFDAIVAIATTRTLHAISPILTTGTLGPMRSFVATFARSSRYEKAPREHLKPTFMAACGERFIGQTLCQSRRKDH
jgi:hypothetical protein